MRWPKAHEKVTPEPTKLILIHLLFNPQLLPLSLSLSLSLSLVFNFRGCRYFNFSPSHKSIVEFFLIRQVLILFLLFFLFFPLTDCYLKPLAYVIHVLAFYTATLAFRSLTSSCKGYVLPNHLPPRVLYCYLIFDQTEVFPNSTKLIFFSFVKSTNFAGARKYFKILRKRTSGLLG